MKKGEKTEKRSRKNQVFRRRLSGQKLDKYGIEFIEEMVILLKCKACGKTWPVTLKGKDPLPGDYWRCPSGCNKEMGEVLDNGE